MKCNFYIYPSPTTNRTQYDNENKPKNKIIAFKTRKTEEYLYVDYSNNTAYFGDCYNFGLNANVFYIITKRELSLRLKYLKEDGINIVQYTIFKDCPI